MPEDPVTPRLLDGWRHHAGFETLTEHLTVAANGADPHGARTGRPLLPLHDGPEFWPTRKPVMIRLAGHCPHREDPDRAAHGIACLFARCDAKEPAA